MVGRIGYEPKIVMTGGVALNKNMVKALENEIGCDIKVSGHCQAVGAIGAAIIAYDSYKAISQNE